MKAKVIADFKDLKENVHRTIGEEFTLSQERFKEINGTEFGTLIEEIKEKKTPTKK